MGQDDSGPDTELEDFKLERDCAAAAAAQWHVSRDRTVTVMVPERSP